MDVPFQISRSSWVHKSPNHTFSDMLSSESEESSLFWLDLNTKKAESQHGATLFDTVDSPFQFPIQQGQRVGIGLG